MDSREDGDLYNERKCCYAVGRLRLSCIRQRIPCKICRHPLQVHNNLSLPLPPPILYSAERPPQFSSNQRGSRAAFRCGLISRRTRHLAALAPARTGRSRAGRRTSGGGERTRCLRQFSDRDWLHPALPVRPESEREREKERSGPCHYYPIIACITVTVNEVSYYAASIVGVDERKEEKGGCRVRRERAEEEPSWM